MKDLKRYQIGSVVLACMLVCTVTLGQARLSENLIYPGQFSPLRTSRPNLQRPAPQPPAKFNKTENAIPNRYIVVLKENTVTDASLKSRRIRVNAIANEFARLYKGTVGFIYETALKGFSIELPSESVAKEISEDAQVQFVEEVGRHHPSDVQFGPPWGLDRIDQNFLPLNNQYVFNGTGAGVTAYILDSGIRTTHTAFGGRASIAANFIHPAQEHPLCTMTPTNNDCLGHGTHVAGTAASGPYGVAKGAAIKSVKVCTANPIHGCPFDAILAAVNWVTNDHLANPNIPAVANMSLGGNPSPSIEEAILNSINSGVTYVVAAGNSGVNAKDFSPARVPEVLTIGASGPTDQGAQSGGFFFSNWGPILDAFGPGEQVLSVGTASDSDTLTASGTSMASPHVAGAVALYLQGRTGMPGCNLHPISGPATTSGGSISTCPDRVSQFIKSNASLVVLNNIGPGSPNRLLLTSSLPATNNPIDNQRFFVWQQYADFLVNEPEPDEPGLNFWTQNITATCGTSFNTNNGCTHAKRIDTSLAFWVTAHPSLFTGGWTGLTSNEQFVHLCYEHYLRRSVPDTDGGFQFWLSVLNSYGNPANQAGINHLIDAFLSSIEYRQRFGPP